MSLKRMSGKDRGERCSNSMKRVTGGEGEMNVFERNL